MKMLEMHKGNWPIKHNIFGVNISATSYEELLNIVIETAKMKKSACVTHIPIHGLIIGTRDLTFRNILNNFEVVAPDGMPVKTILNLLYKTKLHDRVYGPEFMLRVCERAAYEKIGIYLYGSYIHVVNNLKRTLIKRFPSLRVVGCESPPFRELSLNEDKIMVKRINSSNAEIVFIGLGCPKQDIFAYKHKKNINAVQICVGAAFDFISGTKRMAPSWMQRNSLEWLFRLLQEPKRLWKRYFFNNTIFLWYLFLQLTGIKKFTNNYFK
jgi:N-acetylglucosaminyldiphosphoundecaprenol N-acetyl-beta-D-mannosaminyltransferase